MASKFYKRALNFLLIAGCKRATNVYGALILLLSSTSHIREMQDTFYLISTLNKNTNGKKAVTKRFLGMRYYFCVPSKLYDFSNCFQIRITFTIRYKSLFLI